MSETSSARPAPLPDGLRYVRCDPSDELGVAAEQFVYQCYRNADYCESSSRRHVEELEPWRAGSTLHVIVDEDGDVAGVMRSIVAESIAALPAGRFAETAPAASGRVCEISSVAVRPDHRGLGVAAELHAAAFRAGIECAAAGWCFVVEDWLVAYVVESYDFPVQLLGPATWYMGGTISSVYVSVAELMARFPGSRPEAYARAVEGWGPSELARHGLPDPDIGPQASAASTSRRASS